MGKNDKPAARGKDAGREAQVALHVPHGSTCVPECVSFSIPIDVELLRLTDWHVEELFPSSDLASFVPGISRLVVDVERFRDDDREPMSAYGLGPVYTKSLDGRDLRECPPSLRESYLSTWYDPHHRRIHDWMSGVISDGGVAILVDCHSFPNEPLPGERLGSGRPDICLGTSGNTPGWLLDAARRGFKNEGFSVEIDFPYSGCLIPSEFERNPSALGIMIEVNRRLYMDEATTEKSVGFERLRGILRQVILGFRTDALR